MKEKTKIRNIKMCFVCGCPVAPGGMESCQVTVNNQNTIIYYHKPCYDEDIIKKKINEILKNKKQNVV